MAVLLDTSVAIHIREGDAPTLDRYAKLDSAMLSIVSVVELAGGIARAPIEVRAHRKMLMQSLLSDLEIIPFGPAAAAAYESIVIALGHSRTRVLDRMIAATALTVGATLITANVRDFRDIPGLAMDDWSS